jgi:hypothetical protein
MPSPVRVLARRVEGVLQQHCDGHRTYTAGHWSNCRRDRLDLRERNVADQRSLTRLTHLPVNAHIYNYRTRFHPTSSDEIRHPDCCNQIVGLPAKRPWVDGLAMNNGYSAVFPKQKVSARFPYYVGSTDDHSVFADQTPPSTCLISLKTASGVQGTSSELVAPTANRPAFV